MSYKQNATANRDSLFGGAATGGSKKTKKKSSSVSASSSASKSSSKPTPTVPTSKGYQYKPAKKSSKPTRPALSGDAYKEKMREAVDFTAKAKKNMQRGLFTTQDPLASSTYYKRAADDYQLCGEFKLERLHRMNSADCQMIVGALATAASEYTRAAELVAEADDEPMERKREIGRKLHLNAAEAWTNMNEPSKAAASKVQAALALIWGDESSFLPKVALEAIEDSVEAHCPDPLNPYARYRQTGVSAYINSESDETAGKPSAETLEFAQQHVLTRAYAHEPVQEVVYLLVNFGEYASALYAAGAATTILSQDGISTLTISRAFLVETILTLAMGDPIAAEEAFLKTHVQKTFYLNSRECKLAEELFRAVKTRDGDALEEARDIKGSNRAAVNNLPETIRELVPMIRLSGVARKGVPDTYPTKPKESKQSSSSSKSKTEESAGPSLSELAAKKTGYEVEGEEAENIDTGALEDELDALDFGDDESDMSDDDIDLR
jgi:hypothetical protein